jgi:DnaA family protein
MTNYALSPVQDNQLNEAIKVITLNLRIPIEDKEINFLLKTYTRDLATLIQFIKKIDDHSMRSKRKITIPLIKELL